MNLLYNITFENTDLKKSYHITNEQGEDIGTVEGYGDEFGELVSVVKIYHPNYQQKGVGYTAFKKVFDEINDAVQIQIIKGSWHAGGEFQDFEDGMSTNLKVFKDKLKNESPENSAFHTPTGKWAKTLGFLNTDVKLISEDEVIINFTK
jgi:hypothetical protein